MKGFKDTSKTVWLAGGYAKGGRVNGAAKVSKVMREFKSGELHSGAKDGPKVSSRKQAVAIALSEAGKSQPVQKKSLGGVLEAGASFLTGGIPGLISTLSTQRRNRDMVNAIQGSSSQAPTAATLSQPAKKPDDTAQQPMRKGGVVKKADGGTVGKLAVKNAMANRENAVLRGAVARGNRMAAEEQGSEAMVMRRPRGANEPLIQSNAPPRSLLERKCGGGLATMPRMKK